MKDNFVSAPVTLGADVAAAATFTVAYPDGYNAGDFSDASGHKLVLNGDELLQPQDITLAFGAASVTVTNGTGGVLPAFSKGAFQFEIRGKALGVTAKTSSNKSVRVKATALLGVLIDFGAPIALDADGLWDGFAAGAEADSMTLADMATTANDGVLDVPRCLSVTGSAGADQVITFNGFDEYDEPMSETITASSTAKVLGLKAFAKVVTGDIAAGGTAGKTIDVGWDDRLGLPIRIKSKGQIIQENEAGTIINCDFSRLGFQHTESELDAAAIRYLNPGFAGEVIGAGVALEDTVTTGGAITYTVAGVTIVGLTNTIVDLATAGTLYTDNATAADGTEYFTASQYLSAVPAAAINASCPITEYIMVRRTNGKLVLGLDKNTKATATNADVRGTYDPNTACDGTTSFALMGLIAEIYDLGNQQYAA